MEQNENRKDKKQSSPMCNCIPQETEIKGVRLAMAYVPWQKFCTTFSPIEALKRGTAFPELYSPYEGKDYKCNSTESMKRGEPCDE